MLIEIEPQCLRIGKYTDHQQVLAMDPSLRLQPQLEVIDKYNSILSLPILPLSEDAHFKRQAAVLQASLLDREFDWCAAPVLLLLSDHKGNDEEWYYQLFSTLCKAIPALTNHPECYLFPYGCSAMLLAWRHLEYLLCEKRHPYIWVLAVDSDPRLSSCVVGQPQQHHIQLKSGIAAECVLLVKIRLSEIGLTRNWFASETRDREITEANIEPLFRCYSTEHSKGIQQFYAPNTGSAELVEKWATAYHLLHPFVGSRTQVVMTGVTTGELGACSGLYNLLHLYRRYECGEYLHSTLQLEISESQYLGAASYTWHQ